MPTPSTPSAAAVYSSDDRQFGPGLNLSSHPTWDAERRILRLSGSSKSEYQRCPFRFLASRLLRIERAGEDRTNLPAVMGKSLHAALATYYSGSKLAPQIALESEWSGVDVPQEEWMNCGYAKTLWEKYLPVAEEDAWTVSHCPVTLQPMVEWGFTFKIATVEGPDRDPFQLWWSGYTDLCIDHCQSGRTLRTVVDHKFTQRESDLGLLRTRYELSSTITGYLVALEHLTGQEWDGAMVNEIIFRNPLARETSKSKPRFEAGEGHRLFVPFSRDRKERWKSGIIQLAAEIVGRIDDLGGIYPEQWSQFDTACAFPRPCQFAEACAQGSLRDTMELLTSSPNFRPRRSHHQPPDAVAEEEAEQQ